jgi:hypothetical protein
MHDPNKHTLGLEIYICNIIFNLQGYDWMVLKYIVLKNNNAILIISNQSVQMLFRTT